MTIFEKIALWLFINRLKINLVSASKYELLANCRNNFTTIELFYIRVIEQIAEEMKWVTKLDPTINFNMQLEFISRKRKENTEKRREFLNGNS